MRDLKAKATPATPMRPLDHADDLSDHMGEILRHADDLLAEWAKFGAQVRGQVERETQQIGNAVANAVDAAVDRSVAATAAHVDRAVTQAMAERVGAQLQSLTAELSRLEGRAKAASRQVAEERHGDRKILWAIAAGIIVANVLLALVLLRKPAAVEVIPQAVPAPAEVKAPAPPAVDTPPAATGSDVPAAVPSSDPKLESTGTTADGSTKASTEQGSAAVKSDKSGEHPASSEMRGAHGAPSRKR